MQKVELSEIKKIESVVQSDESYISLSQGALKVGGVPIEIKRALQKVLETDKTDYYESAWGILELREKLALYLSKLNKTDISHKNILISHGCMGAISAIFLELLHDCDEIILPEPTYPAYKHVVKFTGGKSVYSKSLDIEELESLRTKNTKMLVFSNPCNPTGEIVLREKLEELARWCEKHEIYLLVDESYDDYIFDEKFYSATSLVNKSEFVIRTGSFSKSLSMSGWRIGFMVVPQSLSYRMGVAQDALLNCPNVIAQHAVLFALDNPEYSKSFSKIVRKRRDLAIELLQPLVDKKLISFQEPRGGFYLFLKTNESDSFDLCMSILREAKVGLIPGRAFGPSGAPYMRLCYARKEEILREGISRIIKFYGE